MLQVYGQRFRAEGFRVQFEELFVGFFMFGFELCRFRVLRSGFCSQRFGLQVQCVRQHIKGLKLNSCFNIVLSFGFGVYGCHLCRQNEGISS